MPYLSFHVKVKQMAAIIIAVANFLDYTEKEVVLVLMMIIYFSDISFCFFSQLKAVISLTLERLGRQFDSSVVFPIMCFLEIE